MGFFSSEKWEDKKKEEGQRTKWLEITDEEISKEIENLDNTDYTLLESQRSENTLLGLHIGMIEQFDSIEKLFRCGLIKRFDRKPTFSEKEKMERQKDTPQFKQYVVRIQRIMDSELKQRIKDYQTKLGLEKPDDWLDLTEKGKEVIEKKRKELESVWAELKSSYDKGSKQVFREKLDQNKSIFPLFMIMGLVNGSMMGHMMAKMDMNFAMYMQGMEGMYEMGYADGSGFGDGGDFGDGVGDALEGVGADVGGFQPAF